MKVVILYHANSEHTRVVEDYVRHFQRRSPESTVELLDLETQAGADAANLYGVVQYPAILALRSDGQVLNQWEGEPLPLMDEVAAYAGSSNTQEQPIAEEQ